MRKTVMTAAALAALCGFATGAYAGAAAGAASPAAGSAPAARAAAAAKRAPHAADLPAVKLPDARSLRSRGRNPYFVLEPGYRLTYSGDEDHHRVRVVCTVLAETKVVDGIETRVVEERETVDGAISEVSRNYFALDPATGTVYYFGESVDEYRGGKVCGHGGSWLAGQKGAQPGMAMPGKPAVGDRFPMEWAPGEALDRFEVVSVTEKCRIPAGAWKDCLKVLETTPLEPGVRSWKLYAPGVGLVEDGSLLLVKVDRAG